MDNLIETTLKNQYFLRRLVGSGGSADVYLAWDKMRNSNMAVKVLRRDLAMNRRFHQAFEKEAKLLEGLKHPNIVRFYEYQRQGDIAFIVMDWVDGVNLRKKFGELGRPLSLGEVAQILQPVCSALHYAHQMDVFHCDIKSSNILIHRNGRDVFLTDFGVARWAHEQAGGGTYPYMAPEQFSRGGLSAQTDIYALAVTIYEMLSGGKLPYQGDSRSPGSSTRERFAWEHIHKPLPPLSQYNSALPAGILEVVQKALNKVPTQRYPSTLALWDAFDRARNSGHVNESDSPTLYFTNPEIPPVGQAPKAPERGYDDRSTIIKKITGTPSQTPRRKPPEQKLFKRPSVVSAHLYGRTGEFAGQNIDIPADGLTIGRGTTCQLRLQERSVSRLHLTILLSKRGAYLRDEGSSLGTYLNGQRIASKAPVTLKHGDVIQIGYFQVFEFRVQ